MNMQCPFITVNLAGVGTPPLRLNIRHILAWQALPGPGGYPQTRILMASGPNTFFDVLQSEAQITTMIETANLQG